MIEKIKDLKSLPTWVVTSLAILFVTSLIGIAWFLAIIPMLGTLNQKVIGIEQKMESSSPSPHYCKSVNLPYTDNNVIFCLSTITLDNCQYTMISDDKGQVYELIPLDNNCVPSSLLEIMLRSNSEPVKSGQVKIDSIF